MSAKGLTAWERWELASFDEPESAAPALPSKGAGGRREAVPGEAAGAVPPASTSGLADESRPTPGELELAALRQAARDEAFAQGRRDGHDEGYKAGYESGRIDGETAGKTLAETLGREQADLLAGIVSSLDARIAGLNAALAPEILALAIEIARKLVGHTLATTPEAVVDIVHQALAQLPVQHATIHLHPEDASLVRQYAGDALAHAGHRLHESRTLARGDVLLDAGGSHVDATLATRWQRVLDGLGPVAEWGAPVIVEKSAGPPPADAPAVAEEPDESADS